MKIFLVDPPMQSIMLARADWFPMGLAYLAGSAKREGHEVLIFNGEHDPNLDYVNLTTYSSNYPLYLDALKDPSHSTWQKIDKIIRDFKPDVVGITSFSVKIASAQRVAAIAKDFNPNIPVIMGGQHVTIMTDTVMSDPNIDFVIRGEGELPFLDFLRQLNSFQQWETVPSLSYKTNGHIIHNPQGPLMSDLGKLALPAREALYDIENYESHSLAKLFASRGCPYKCNYCGTQNVWTNKLRHVPEERVLEEIIEVKKLYGSTTFTFFDDVFAIDKKQAMKLLNRMIEANLGITWDCLTRANLVSDEILSIMKKAGCTKIDMGVESGSDRILIDTEKGVNKEQILKGSRLIKKHKIFLYTFFMIGLPTETEKDVMETKRFLLKLKPDWAGISIFTPIPGTGIYKRLQEQGLISENPDFSRFSHQSPHSNFAFNMENQESFPKLAQEMIDFVQKYNGSWRNLLRRAMTRNYHKNIRLLFSDMKRVLTWKEIMQSSHQGSHSKFYNQSVNSTLKSE